MFVALIFLFTWQVTNDQRYQEPFKKCVEATYANSDLKMYADKFIDNMKEKTPPVITFLGPTAYAFYINRSLQFSTTKVTPVPNTVATYHYDHNSKTGNIGVTWSF